MGASYDVRDDVVKDALAEFGGRGYEFGEFIPPSPEFPGILSTYRVKIRLELVDLQAIARSSLGQRFHRNVGDNLVAILLVEPRRHELNISPCHDDDVALFVATEAWNVMAVLGCRPRHDGPWLALIELRHCAVGTF